MPSTLSRHSPMRTVTRRRPSGRPAKGQRTREQKAAAAVFTIGMFMSIMDTQIVNVALTTLGRGFHAGTAQIQWVVTGYLLSLATFVPVAAWLGDRLGSKRVYLYAIAIFTLSSGVCAASTSLLMLSLARVAQGIGGGMMLPLGQTVLYRAYPPQQRVKVARSISRVTVIAPSSAPIIGGLLVSSLSWHWVFLVNLPTGVAQFAFALYALDSYKSPERGRFDLLGACLGGGGLALLLYALSQGPGLGWTSARVLATGMVGVLALALFGHRETRLSDPMLKLRLLADRMLRRACGVVGLMTFSFFGCIVFTSLYLQEGRGLSAIQSGLTTFPCAIGIGISSQLASRIYPRVGPRRLMMTGFLGIGIVASIMAETVDTAGLWTVRAEMLCFGLAVSCVMLSTQASAFSRISHADTSHASSIFMAVQRSASAFSVALLSTVIGIADHGRVVPDLDAFRSVYLVMAVAALFGLGAAARVHDSDAAATMSRAPRTGANQPGGRPPTADGLTLDELAFSRLRVGTGKRSSSCLLPSFRISVGLTVRWSGSGALMRCASSAC